MISQQQGSKASIYRRIVDMEATAAAQSFIAAQLHIENERDSTPRRVVGLHLISLLESVAGRSDPTGISKEIDMEIHDPETSPASDKLTEGRGSINPYANGTAETTTGGIVEQRIMDAAGVQAQQYDSEVNDRDQVFVDCIDTHANTEQRHGRPSESDETNPRRSVNLHRPLYERRRKPRLE